MCDRQRSHAWYEARRGKLTASNLGGVLGLGRLSRKEAMRRALGIDEFKGNCATQWGQDNEMNAIVDYSIATEHAVDATGLHIHPVYDWIAGSPDGLVGEEGMIEVKCPYYGYHRLHEEVPIYYYVQMNALLEITGRAWCDYICWSPTSMIVYRVYKDKELFNYLLHHYGQFYAAMCAYMDPPMIPDKVALEAEIQQSMAQNIDYKFWYSSHARLLSKSNSHDDVLVDPHAEKHSGKEE